MTNKNLIYLFFLIFAFQFINSQSKIKMITPPNLKQGDTIALVATARKTTDVNLQPALDLLKSWGLKVVLGNTVGLENKQLAGTDEERASDFQNQLDDPKIKAIWCVKGGYGTVRMIDMLDFSKFKKKPKWIVGFSDVTVLHSHLNTLGIKSIHGTMPVSIATTAPESIETLQKALFGENIIYSLPPSNVTPENRLGKASGQLVGGNLSILYSLMGSKSQIDCKNKILFIEDLDEYLYHIDRMMINLKRSGYFDSIKGIIVGGFTKIKDNDVPWGKNALQIIEDVTNRYNIPIIYNFPAGHINDNRALIMGANIKMEVTENRSFVSYEF